MNTPSINAREVIEKGDSVTASERYLAYLCEKTFLSLWSYPGIYRDQGKKSSGDGKEVCDLLVVFGRHVLIFSDKDCRFPGNDNYELNWQRWYRSAIDAGARQIWGAERWIKDFPERLFLDRKCTKRFPISLPSNDEMIVHRIIVARDSSGNCSQIVGGSGSLLIDSHVIGDEHLGVPFTLGQVNPQKGYIHVFDHSSLDIVLRTLNTISDFVAYLDKKQNFLTGKVRVRAAGEEELLASHLGKLNEQGEHDFMFEQDCELLLIDEGHWKRFCESPERIAQLAADRRSYLWDELIEKFSFHLMTGTQYPVSGTPVLRQVPAFRFLARESRTRRRLLAISLSEVLLRSGQTNSIREARVMPSTAPEEPHYVFVTLKREPGLSDEDYRHIRRALLMNYCKAVKVNFPQAVHIVGIATEDIGEKLRSEDFAYLDTTNWNEDAEREAKSIKNQFQLLMKSKLVSGTVHEYPVDNQGRVKQTQLSRNSKCSCGSGKRFKRCCGDPNRWNRK